MRPNFFSAALGVAMLACACAPAFADGIVTHQTGANGALNFRALSNQQLTQPTAIAKNLGGNSASGNGIRAGEAFANPFRAYPPSCLEAPLALGLYNNDPYRLQTTLRLSGDPLGGASEEVNFTEVDTITVFRVVCSSGQSATLIEIDRPSSAAAYPYPVFPGVFVTLSDNSSFPLRAVNDPNTFLASSVAYNPLVTSDVFVLENYYGSSTQFDFNQAFTLNVDNLLSGSAHDVASFNLGTYLPSSYPEASEALKINGYMSGNWYDPAHNGEGIQIEVGEQTYPARYITAAWYTFDDLGFPYWLFGSGGFTAGDAGRSATVTLYYGGNGGFAGDFGSTTTSTLWGTLNITFPTCNSMTFKYAAASGLPSTVPQGSGTKTWSRVSNLNGLTCL
jgi:hypothetical protein